uniref:Uncharacterized protein n=1 Tax=viral metagenome TaxID=1070528 RepID=A0A6M3LQJ4_9ZZZZ
MILDCTCADITIQKWENLMSNKKRFSYKKLCRLIKKNLSELYYAINLNFPNPYKEDTFETKTHYILTHSAIEYFFKK